MKAQQQDGNTAGSPRLGNALRHLNGVTRRDALKVTALAASATFVPGLRVMAGPFQGADFEKLIPSDKKLQPDWVKSLSARGERTAYRGEDLAWIGMPVGGLCAGQVYLGGDGTLWHWDIFNKHVTTGAEHYAHPLKPSSPLAQGFELTVVTANGSQTRALNRAGWDEVTFNGEYPVGTVEYRAAECPVAVTLEAWSPFIPLNVEDSSFPATVMQFRLKNTSNSPVKATLSGWLENAVCLHSAERHSLTRRNRVVRRAGLLAIETSAEAAPDDLSSRQPDILFDDFERESYEPWTATGTAFGKGPVAQKQVPEYQGNLGMHGDRAVNSHAAAAGANVGGRDAQTGTLTSKPFKIERRYINFLVGGGGHKGKTCVNLVVGGKTVLSAVGPNDNRMRPASWDVRQWLGQTAQIEVVDKETGGWGNIGLDNVVFSDRPHNAGPLNEEPDFGTMTLALLDPQGDDAANELDGTRRGSDAKPVASLSSSLSLGPGESKSVVFLITWHFPNASMERLPKTRWYAGTWPSAMAVAEDLGRRFGELERATKLWRDTWYDSTLPYWFLDRTFLNTSILASSTCHRFSDGRFWAWEGVGCCHGTCGHVWQYAQAMGRIFPELERDTRERVDFGLAQKKDGAIHFRAEFNNYPAIDSQAGTVLRALREHQVSADNAWLRRNWSAIKRATEWLIAKDGDGDGIIVTNQHNTLDTDWFGPVAWLSGMYLAALRAAEEMASEMGDEAFANSCQTIFARGRAKLVADLFNGEYFINKPDPRHLDAINSGSGCEIDQVLGQSWAFQLGLGRILPESETRSALRALWRYNFAPDVGAYRAVNKPGRWYAMAGEAGLLMCTFPKPDWDYAKAKGKGADWAAGYFNECMNGFEYQVAWHMIAEGMVLEGLAITRAVHDRYHARRRNPWNEVECGDHYARSMASYGIFLTACGFEYHGPKAHIGFAPKLTPENFRAAFTAAEGWGTYSQSIDATGALKAKVEVKHGNLRCRTLAFELPKQSQSPTVRVAVNGKAARATHRRADKRIEITLPEAQTISAGQSVEVTIS